MRIYRIKNKWWCSWTENGETVRKSCRTEDKKVAELKAKQWERERADPDYTAKAQATFAVESKAYLASRKAGKINPETLEMYECKIGHLNRLLPQPLLQITPGAAETYFLTRREEGASISTLYKEWVALKQVLENAARRGVFTQLILPLRPRWVKAASEPKKVFLRYEELERLCAQLEPARVPAVKFVFATGARLGELLRATPGDCEQVTKEVDGRSVTYWQVHLRGTKSRAANRLIPIPNIMSTLLEDSLNGAKNGPRLFEEWPNARRDLARACKRAGVPAVTWNDLRRSFASKLAQAGVSNVVLRHLMGHTTTAMVDRVYAKVMTDDLARLLEMQLR